MPLTPDQVQAVYVAALNAVVGYLQPQPYDRRIVLIAVTGPAGSTLDIYRGYGIGPFKLSRVFPADARTYDTDRGDPPINIFAGEAATFAWTSGAVGAGQTASASVTSKWGVD